MAEKKARCLLASEDYVKDVHYVVNHFDVDDFRQGRLEDGNWEFYFKVTDAVMIDIIAWFGFKLNWQPLKIGLYYV